MRLFRKWASLHWWIGLNKENEEIDLENYKNWCYYLGRLNRELNDILLGGGDKD